MTNAAMKPADRQQLRAMSNDLVRKPASEPINKVMFNEGRRFAVDVLQTCIGLTRSSVGRAELVRKLRTAAAGRPRSIAAGIDSVIEVLVKEGV